jgi:hypothetical protein
MNEINEKGNEHVDHSKIIPEFINLFKPEIFLSRFTTIFNLIYFPLQIVKKIVIIVSTLEIICA